MNLHRRDLSSKILEVKGHKLDVIPYRMELLIWGSMHFRPFPWRLTNNPYYILIAEVTTISMGVGYEIGRAVAMGKRVICLYRNVKERKLSAMIAGCPDVERFVYESANDLRNLMAIIFPENGSKNRNNRSD